MVPTGLTQDRGPDSVFRKGLNIRHDQFNIMLPPGIQTKLNPFQVHTHQATIKLAYRANFDSMCLVTDAIGALGLKDGVYTLGQQQIQARGFE